MYLPLKRSFDAHTMDSVRDICPFHSCSSAFSRSIKIGGSFC